ncbi:MAG: DNA polymerase III subunit gamma/tau [Thermodesulfobacteriota bacterium]
MSYLVLARKYRPRTFADMVGQAHVVRPLVNALKSGRIAHAYLFAGARGVGKTTAARLLAMALSCSAEPAERPCGQCGVCREIIEGQAVDVFEVDGASNRGIDEIRQLRETVKYLPSRGRYKIYIIDEVHMLTPQAFNALLKTLEEPPEHVVFIFATTEAHKVLPTILSRCQRYDFKRIRLEEIVVRLKSIAELEDIRISDSALRLIGRESEGSLRDALSLFDQVIAFSGLTVRDEDVADALGLIDQTLISDLVKAALSGDAGSALDVLDRVYSFGYDSKDFAGQVVGYLRALIVAKVSREPEKILDLLDAELAEIKVLAGRASLETLNFHFQAWLEALGRLTRAAQPRLILEALLIRLAQVEPVRPLAELTARLEALLGSGPGQAPAARRPIESNVPRPAVTPSAPSPRTEHRPAASVSPGASTAPAVGRPSPVSNWEAFADMLRQEAPLILNLLEQGRVALFKPGQVEIVFGHKNLPELVDREKLLGLLTDFLGSRPSLTLRYEESGAEDPSSGPQLNKEDLLGHPLVKEAKQIFSGEVIEVLPEAPKV